jgi:repressor of nif and glnA expression
MSQEINWERLLAKRMHPTQVMILAAMEVTGEPLSATALSRTFDEAISVRSVDYHLNRLAQYGVVVKVNEVQRRGTMEKFYRPAP